MLQLEKDQQRWRFCLQGGEIFPQGRFVPIENSYGKADGLLDPIEGLGVAVMGMSKKIDHAVGVTLKLLHFFLEYNQIQGLRRLEQKKAPL